LSLLELLLASTAMTIIAAALGTLAATVHTSNDFCQQQGQALMHARAAWLRIQDSIENAQASEPFPGCIALPQTVAGYAFPETLVIWKPTGAAAAPTGLPRVSELVIYTPNPQSPNELWELSAPANANTVPAVSDTTGWQTLLASLRADNASQKLVITNRLRTASTNIVAAGAAPSTSNLRGAVRFRVAVTPSMADFAAYRAGTMSLANVPWPLDMYGQKAALRSVTCFAELQLATEPGDNSADTALPYFGAAAIRYSLTP
jgi:hypothetical protein